VGSMQKSTGLMQLAQAQCKMHRPILMCKRPKPNGKSSRPEVFTMGLGILNGTHAFYEQERAS